MFRIVSLTAENFDEVVGANTEPISRTAFAQQERLRTGETLLHRLVAVTEDGHGVGYGHAVSGPWDPILSPGHFQVQISVPPAWRRKGVGGSIYRDLERFAREHGGIAIDAPVADSSPEDLSWAQRRGFHVRQHVFASRLDLDAFDPQLSVAGARVAEALGLTFASITDYMDSELWFERYADFYYSLVEDDPGVFGRKLPDAGRLKDLLTGGPHWDPNGIILGVVRGQWIALSALTRLPDGDYYTHMTGVSRAYRRHGVGLAVKCAAIQYAKRQGAHFMHTHNDSNNAPMLALNRKLGFQAQGGTYWVTKTLS